MSIQITLERDGHDQPWGFRLQGGVDVGLPLSILRVLVGTPAELVLKKGDVVSKIGQTGTHSLSHQQAVDLFNCGGNQLSVTIKRVGAGGVVAASSQPSVSSLQASAAIRQQQQLQQAAVVASPPVGNTCESPQVAALPRTTFVLKSDLPPPAPTVTGTSDDLSVTNQPYRTLPLIQPSVKVLNEIGVGTYSHLKLQEDICTGVREPQLVPVTPAQAQALKANEFIMKQKTQQGLVTAASDHQRAVKSPPLPTTGPIAGPVPVKLPPSPSLPPQSPPFKAPPSPQPAKYNSASGLHANQATGGLNKKGGTGMINPPRSSGGAPAPVVLTPNKDYNPTESATWKLLLETDTANPPSLARLEDQQSAVPGMNEHDPIFSEVYAAPKVGAAGQKPVRPAFPGTQPKLPQNPGAPGQVSPRFAGPGGVNPKMVGSATPPGRAGSPKTGDGAMSQVAAAALADAPPSSRGQTPKYEPVPIYETNSIGGRKRIAQSSSFNKLMMNMLGE